MDDIALLQNPMAIATLVADGYSQCTVCSSHAIGGMR